jgi:ParB-like chromosome segregation protein Spo0J
MTREDAVEQRESLSAMERKTRKAINEKAKRLETLEIKYVPIDRVYANEYNPNRQSEHDFELLLRSIEEDGFTQPIVCVAHPEIAEAWLIVDGEHRWRAAAKLGFTEIPIAVSEMGLEQARVATLRHNRARGSEDLELAAQVLRDLQELDAIDWAKESLMLDDIELQRLLEDVPAPELYAAEQHSEAWAPDKGGVSQDVTVANQEKEGVQFSGTQKAVEERRALEKRLADARSEEQRELIRSDEGKKFHRISVMLYGEEAEIVRRVLGGAQAQTIVDLCRKEAGILDEQKEKGWVTIDSILGSRAMPADAAKVVREAIAKAKANGDLSEESRWRFVELMAAEYLAS